MSSWTVFCWRRFSIEQKDFNSDIVNSKGFLDHSMQYLVFAFVETALGIGSREDALLPFGASCVDESLIYRKQILQLSNTHSSTAQLFP